MIRYPLRRSGTELARRFLQVLLPCHLLIPVKPQEGTETGDLAVNRLRELDRALGKHRRSRGVVINDLTGRISSVRLVFHRAVEGNEERYIVLIPDDGFGRRSSQLPVRPILFLVGKTALHNCELAESITV